MVQDRSGEPDPEIFGLTDSLNSLPGICTLQSCSGHIKHGFVEHAHLWLKLCEEIANRFYLAAPSLAQHHLVEDVVIRFGTGEGEVVEIIFAGNECETLSEAMAIILDFFRSMSEGSSGDGVLSPGAG